jgi:hypothetical protein
MEKSDDACEVAEMSLVDSRSVYLGIVGTVQMEMRGKFMDPAFQRVQDYHCLLKTYR